MVGLVVGLMLVHGLAVPVHSALYSCTESSGVTVITDSPAQLRGCTLLSAGRPTPPEQTPLATEPPPRRASEAGGSQAQETPPSPSVLAVPLERFGSLFVVTVQINGTRPAKMILDTGASHTILSYAIARDLSLWAQHRSTSMTMHTAGGTVQADVLPIASIHIGRAEVRNIEGLLGLNVLGRFTVTLDSVRNRLLLGVHP